MGYQTWTTEHVHNLHSLQTRNKYVVNENCILLKSSVTTFVKWNSFGVISFLSVDVFSTRCVR